MSSLHDKRFPNESKEYRDARNKLLEEEKKLGDLTAEVAALRSKLPLGGKVEEDYIFEELDEKGKLKETKLSELFKPGFDSLAIYSFMYGPQAESGCPGCTSIIDGLNGVVPHLNDRMNFVVIGKAPIEKLNDWKEKRGWNKTRFLSSGKNNFNQNYFGEDEQGRQLSHLNIFRKTDEGIFHLYGNELTFLPLADGEEERDMDLISPIGNMFDLIPEGRGKNWFPKNNYTS